MILEKNYNGEIHILLRAVIFIYIQSSERIFKN